MVYEVNDIYSFSYSQAYDATLQYRQQIKVTTIFWQHINIGLHIIYNYKSDMSHNINDLQLNKSESSKLLSLKISIGEDK